MAICCHWSRCPSILPFAKGIGGTPVKDVKRSRLVTDTETPCAPESGDPAVCGLLTDRGAGLVLAVVEPRELLRDLLAQQIAECLPDARVVAVAGVDELAAERAGDAARCCILVGANGDSDALRDAVAAAGHAWPSARIAALPETAGREAVAAAMAAGAHGVIPKSYSKQSFAAALALVLSGQPFVPWALQGQGTTSEANTVVLTAREQHVLGYLAEGLSNRDISRLLGIREVTVKLHLRSLFKKMGVNNRTKAVRQAIRLGILD